MLSRWTLSSRHYKDILKWALTTFSCCGFFFSFPTGENFLFPGISSANAELPGGLMNAERAAGFREDAGGRRRTAEMNVSRGQTMLNLLLAWGKAGCTGMVVEITGVAGVTQDQAVKPKGNLLEGRRESSDPSSTTMSSHMFLINPWMSSMGSVHSVCMHLSFLGTQQANFIQILCFSTPLGTGQGYFVL